MARIIRQTKYHNCYQEIRKDFPQGLCLGSIVECSCGKQYQMQSDQRKGNYWADLTPPPDFKD